MSGLRTIPPLKKTPAVSSAGVKATPPPAQRAGGRPLNIVDPFRPIAAPRGPQELHLGQKRVTGIGGPGPQPVDFPGSGAEWVWYDASADYHKDPKDPRAAPYVGGEFWTFQAPENAANPREAGGTISDFVYLYGATSVIVRIEGFYWHWGQGGAQTGRDLFLITHAGAAGDRVVRVNDGEYMFDETGSVAVALLSDILAGHKFGGGILREPRYADFTRGIA
jgi:hypothetical protein